MVKVEEVSDSPYASSSSSRTSSSVSLSSISSNLHTLDPDNETVFQRLTALVDIVPPTTRHAISTKITNTVAVVKKGGKWIGNAVWIITTSALLVGLPLALSLEDEAKIVAQEKEMLAQQQGVQQMLAPSNMYPQAPPPKQQQALVPPGF